MIRVRVRGADEAARTVERRGPAAAQAVELAITAAAEMIRADAATRAPVRTGNLRRSLHTRRVR